MRCVVLFVALCTGLVTASSKARAEPGDMQIRFVSGHEIGVLRHPNLDYQPASWPKVYLPRLGIHYLYEMTGNLVLGAGIEASLQRNLSTTNIGYEHFYPANLQAAYNDILIPLILQTRLNDGSDWSWLAEVSTGLASFRWHDSTLRAPGQSIELPLRAEPLWRFAWFGRVSIAREWRPNANFGLHCGALAGVKSQGDLHLGLFVSGAWLWLSNSD